MMTVEEETRLLLWPLLLVLLYCLNVDGKSPKSLTIKGKNDCSTFSLKQFSVINIYFYGPKLQYGYVCDIEIEEGEKDDPNVVGPNPKICLVVGSFVDNDCSVNVELYNFEPEWSFGGPEKKYTCSSRKEELEEKYCTHMHKLYIQIKVQESDEQKNVSLRVFPEQIVSTWEPPEDDEWKKWTLIGCLLGTFSLFVLGIVIWYCCLKDMCRSSNHRHSNNNQVPQEVLDAYPLDSQTGTTMLVENQAQPPFQGCGTGIQGYPIAPYGLHQHQPVSDLGYRPSTETHKTPTAPVQGMDSMAPPLYPEK